MLERRFYYILADISEVNQLLNVALYLSPLKGREPDLGLMSSLAIIQMPQHTAVTHEAYTFRKKYHIKMFSTYFGQEKLQKK